MRWKVATPLKFSFLVNAAQSIGEWPGDSKTLPREFGVEGVVVVVVVRRCWLLAGGPLLGSGPLEGTRKEAAVLERGVGGGRLGGGMRDVALLWLEGLLGCDGGGGGGMGEEF